MSTAFAQPPSDRDQCQNGAGRLAPGFALRKELSVLHPPIARPERLISYDCRRLPRLRLTAALPCAKGSPSRDLFLCRIAKQAMRREGSS